MDRVDITFKVVYISLYVFRVVVEVEREVGG